MIHAKNYENIRKFVTFSKVSVEVLFPDTVYISSLIRVLFPNFPLVQDLADNSTPIFSAPS